MSRLKQKEAEFAAQMATMKTNMNVGILASAGIAPTAWDAIESEIDGWFTTRSSYDLAKAAAKSAYEARNAGEKEVRTDVQSVVDKLYATSTITNETLTSLGLPPRSTPGTQVPPVTVTNVSATANTNGTCLIRFKRNGNTSRTQFEIQTLDGGVWDVIGTVLTTRFEDPFATPGVAKTYRVVSVNARGRSAPSNEVSIYSGDGAGALRAA